MKENFVDRLSRFVDEHGGVYEVAGKVDVSPQTFYTMRRRGSLPNLSLIYSLKEKFDDLDINWLLFGERDNKEDNKEIEKLKMDLEREKSITTALSSALLGKSLDEALCPGLYQDRGQIVWKNGKRQYLRNPGLVLSPKCAKA